MHFSHFEISLYTPTKGVLEVLGTANTYAEAKKVVNDYINNTQSTIYFTEKVPCEEYNYLEPCGYGGLEVDIISMYI